MLLSKTSPKIWLISTVLISLVVLSEPKQKGNSYRRADDESEEDNHDKKTKVKDESSDSSDDDSGKRDTSKEKQAKARISDADVSDDNNEDTGRLHSTRGLKAEDFEPEESHRSNPKKAKESAEESDGSSNRRRRSIKELHFKGIEEPIEKYVLRNL